MLKRSFFLAMLLFVGISASPGEGQTATDHAVQVTAEPPIELNYYRQPGEKPFCADDCDKQGVCCGPLGQN